MKVTNMFEINVILINVLFIHIATTEDIVTSMNTSTSMNENPFSLEDTTSSITSIESFIDVQNSSTFIIHDIALFNETRNQTDFTEVSNFSNPEFLANEAFINDINSNNEPNVQLPADRSQNKSTNELFFDNFIENLTNSEILTMDAGELIDESIRVLTDNSTEPYSVSIKTDDYLYPSNATRDEPVFSETNTKIDIFDSTTFISNDTDNIHLNAISIFETDNQTFFIETKSGMDSEISKNKISEKLIVSGGSQDMKIPLEDLDKIVPPPKNEISEKPIASEGSENVTIAMKDIDEIIPPQKNEISEKPIASEGTKNVKIAMKDLDEIVPPPRNEISEKPFISDGSQNVKIALKDLEQTVPPPPLVPPPPFPPDDIPQELDAPKTRVIPDKEITNTKFQPRAQNIPDEMREAMRDPNNIVVSTGTKIRKIKPTTSTKDTFEPDLPPPPPPPLSVDDKRTTDVIITEKSSIPYNTSQTTTQPSSDTDYSTSLKTTLPPISLQTPMRMPPPPPRSKSNVGDEFVQKPVMLPLPPPFNTQKSKIIKSTKDRPIRVQLPPPPPIRRGHAQTSESKNTWVPAGPKQQLPAMPPPPPLPPTKTRETLNTIQQSPYTIQKQRQKSKSERINVGKKSFTVEGNDLKTDSNSKNISKYLSYFDPESLYHQSPWSIKALNIQLHNPKVVAPVTQPTKKPEKIVPVTHPTKKPVVKLQTDTTNNVDNRYVRQMIETIEKARTQPFSGTTFQFFAPGINKQVYNTRPQTPKAGPSIIPQQRTDVRHTKVIQKTPVSINPNVPPPIFTVSNRNQVLSSHWSNNGLKRNRRTDRNISSRMAKIAFKVRAPNQIMRNEQGLISLGRKYIDREMHMNTLRGNKQSSNRLRGKDFGQYTRNKYYVGYTALKPSSMIKNTIPKNIHLKTRHDTRGTYQTASYKFRSSGKSAVKQPVRLWKKNDPPPPIVIKKPNSPAFKVPYIPPPPPPPKYKPPARKPPVRYHPTTIIPKVTTTTESNHSQINTTKDVNTMSTDNTTIHNDPSYEKDLPNSEEICQNCTYVSNFCYLREPFNCNRFLLCYKQGNIIRATERECSFGLFWSESKLACIQASRADCQTDPCKTRGVRSHPYIGKCRAYWTCRRRRSDARCCPKGYGFGGGRSACIPNNECHTECQAKTFVVENVCHLNEVPSSPFEYMDGGMKRSCAPGTRFQQSVCTCIRSNIKNTPDRKPIEIAEIFQCGADMKLDFSGKTHDAFDDKSGHPQSIGVFDVVQTMKEQAMFNGRGSLKLWRFSNVELGPELAIKFRFYAHGRSMRSETLLSNCIGKKNAAAIDIRLETDILEIIFTVKTTKSPETHMRMFYKPFQWNPVILRYDGSSLSAAIGDVSKTIYVEGVIPTKHAAVSIGGCGTNDGFIGYMDDVIIYNDCIPDDVRDLVFE